MIQSPSLSSRVNAFIQLGKIIGRTAEAFSKQEQPSVPSDKSLYDSLQTAVYHNPWFTPENVVFSLKAWKDVLQEDSINSWLTTYENRILIHEPKHIAVIMAGNIPLVGFHDFMSTIISGNYFDGKLSSDDKILLPALAEILCRIEPGLAKMIRFSENTMKDFDAIIATGSNNTARYFEYYFSKYPHIIRKNRNGVAVLTGNESIETLVKIGSDICSYFGLGCRNVSKIFIPVGYDPAKVFVGLDPYIKILSNHNKYMNNHSYYRSIFLLNNTPHLDNGAIILTESGSYSSPIPVIYYQFYNNLDELQQKLSADDQFIQCIATEAFISEKTVFPGNTQKPDLSDYADGIDTMKFLTEI
jgi:hypothetical protein